MPDATRACRLFPADAVLDIGDDVGALILYTDAEHDEREIEVSLIDESGKCQWRCPHPRRSWA